MDTTHLLIAEDGAVTPAHHWTEMPEGSALVLDPYAAAVCDPDRDLADVTVAAVRAGLVELGRMRRGDLSRPVYAVRTMRITVPANGTVAVQTVAESQWWDVVAGPLAQVARAVGTEAGEVVVRGVGAPSGGAGRPRALVALA